MSSKIKNLIFVLVGLALILVYILFFKKDKVEENLTVNNAPINTAEINTVSNNPIDDKLSNEILATLSSIKSITLEDKIFKSQSFNSLVDGTVPLVQDGNEGRPNPFAPIGTDATTSTNTTAIADTTKPETTTSSQESSTPTTSNPNTTNTSQNKKPN
ncbi:MAG: hypothetical protein KBD14_01235 [Candidatus Pacebacteria bacterium]|nr:hypothetical protein [Candidatus Paceibacterota bacterium]